MDVILVCDLSPINIKWLEDIHNLIDSYSKIKLTIDYASNKLLVNIKNSLDETMYIKKCSCNRIPMIIKKLNT
uniref:Uncharacterized protein n=1 Tax=viral metagenome TaxID=1070528 RepID=A0A6C0LJH5_9ZZZZ